MVRILIQIKHSNLYQRRRSITIHPIIISTKTTLTRHHSIIKKIINCILSITTATLYYCCCCCSCSSNSSPGIVVVDSFMGSTTSRRTRSFIPKTSSATSSIISKMSSQKDRSLLRQGNNNIRNILSISMAKQPQQQDRQDMNNLNDREVIRGGGEEEKYDSSNSMRDFKRGTFDKENIIKVLGICGGIGSGKSTVCQLLVSDFNCLAHIDADMVAHSVYAPGSEGVEALVNVFGTSILAKEIDTSTNVERIKLPHEIDRPSLGSIVFNDINAMKLLEQIVWPRALQLIQQQIEQIIIQYKNDLLQQKDDNTSPSQQQEATKTLMPIIIVEAAMLLDAEWHKTLLHGVWVVTTAAASTSSNDDNIDTGEDIAINRLMETRNLSSDEAKKRYDAQKFRRGIYNLQEEMTNNIVTGVIVNNGSLNDLKDRIKSKLSDPALVWHSKIS